MKTALIVDPDVAFGFWLSRGLDQAGYQGYPAKDVGCATELLRELRLDVGLLIFDPMLPGAAELIERLRESNQLLKAVAVFGDQPHLPSIPCRVDLCCRKPATSDETKRREWIAHVEELLPASLFEAALENSTFLRKCAAALASRSSGAAPVRWKEWEGRVIDDHFRLGAHLGGSAGSAVFLTDSERGAAAIKLVLGRTADRDSVLSTWERAAGLSHPGLVRLFGMGSCESEGTGLHYLVMEYGEENLAEVLRQRPLTPGEARELLDPVLDALGYLHSRGLVHGHVKPSNILATSERLKLSSDWLQAAGEPRPGFNAQSSYDAPEMASGFISPAADVWSLGITLVEALTQRPLLPKQLQQNPPALPVKLPPLFLDVARHCLQPDPQERQTIPELAEHLRHAALVSEPQSARFRLGRWRYAAPAVALGAVFSAILQRPVHRTPAPPPAVRAALAVQPISLPASPVARHMLEPPTPAVSRSSLETIQGTIEVRVRVRVDASGRVVQTELASPGPSRYFADRSLEAARYCRFDPMAAQAAAEDWMLRFDYTADGTNVSAERLNR